MPASQAARQSPQPRRRVVVTGVGALSPLGHDWPSVKARLQTLQNAVQYMPEWEKYEGLHTRLGVPCAPFELPPHYNRKTTRSMGRVALMGVRASEMALQNAGLLGSGLLGSGQMGIAFGSSIGSPAAISDCNALLTRNTTEGITANTYIKMMSHTATVNIGVFFGITGRIYTTCSACTASSQGIGYAFEAIQAGHQTAMLAGGSEELHAIDAAIFDTLFATSTRNNTPCLTPRPFDRDRDGLVLGEGACALVLEELEHALARNAPILGEILGWGTNSDGAHVTRPTQKTMEQAMQLALQSAGIEACEVGYINAHGTATDQGDEAESHATLAVFGSETPISSLKSYMGHTLGACGALEAWMSLEMMREGWFAPTLNLDNRDPRCAQLDYITGPGRQLQTQLAVSNNFAFGGINTSIVLRRWQGR